MPIKPAFRRMIQARMAQGKPPGGPGGMPQRPLARLAHVVVKRIQRFRQNHPRRRVGLVQPPAAPATRPTAVSSGMGAGTMGATPTKKTVY